LALQNFKTGPHATLSYKTQLVNVTTDGADVFLQPIGADAGIIFLAFSVMVLIQNSSHLELLPFFIQNVSPGTRLNFRANSSHFNFDEIGGSPYAVHFM
jgi:hypothetical protein